jgi:hypothetical protein
MEKHMATTTLPRPSECFDFVWRRRVKGPGFRWQQDPRDRWLLLGPPQESLQEYEPLVEETGLFLTFAHLDGTKEAFLGFANSYGRLGTYHALGTEHGEPLYEWQRHHRWLQFLAGLREECLRKRPALDNFVRWKADELVFRFPKIGTSAEEQWRHRGELRTCPKSKRGQPLFEPADLVGPARWFLVYAMQDWLVELEGWQKPIASRMIWSETDNRPQLVFGPSSLLGAMVCQLAAAVHGGWPFQECAFCHKYFRLEPGVNRANRLTCSRTCKQYLHNRKVKRAGELFAEGRTVGQIVKELDVQPYRGKSSVELVETWIRKSDATSRLGRKK